MIKTQFAAKSKDDKQLTFFQSIADVVSVVLV